MISDIAVGLPRGISHHVRMMEGVRW